MDFYRLCHVRYSYRGYYIDRPVEEEKLERILQCARMAPSAANRQPWRIHLISDLSVRELIHDAYPRKWLLEAPLIAIFTGIEGTNWKREDGADYLLCDVSILADHFIMAATEEGLGTCWIAHFDEAKVCAALKLPSNEKPLIITPLGYAKAGTIRKRTRKPLEEILVRIDPPSAEEK